MLASSLAWGAAQAAPSTPDAEAHARYLSALRLVGEEGARAAALESFAETDRDQPDAVDALHQAARLYEDTRPDRARDLYALLVARYPTSRLAPRARARAAFLDEGLRTGAAPLAAYLHVLSGYAGRPPVESVRLMEQLVDAHPDFALADRALLWLAAQALHAGNTDDATRRFLDVERRFPGTPAWAEARKGRADVALASGHPMAARALYRSMAGAAGVDANLAAVARDGAARAETMLRRRIGLALALTYLVSWLVLTLRRARRSAGGRRSVPTELLYYLPVAAIFVVGGAGARVAKATLILAAGGALIVYAFGAAARTTSTVTRRRWALRVLGLMGAVAALFYTAIQQSGLMEVLLETLRHGPSH